ncbi:hypothetical protein D2T29_10750 [Sinirhodobacter populi]|uniref:Uncharacterized protein n=1 Tax=Paenirhodobacter populi TaxID=2306993 RepID=A0A443KFG8_9RHOB|nr:hypothetical protein [Sinirhodobacter populi]RWR31503.1 hypothetical protein D2T29_10750 [Sinirhodobacter populi]
MADNWWEEAPEVGAINDDQWWTAAPEVEGAPITGLREQAMSGVNEGIAGLVGLPVDAVSGAINGVSGLVNGALGTEIPAIQNPVGGSQWLREGVLAPTISNVAPQTGVQRFGRRVGQELGATAIPALGMASRAGSLIEMGRSLVPQLSSAVGSGIGAQTAREIAPDSAAAEVAGQIIGGVGATMAARALRPNPNPAPPTVDDLNAQAGDLYRQGDARAAAGPQDLNGLKTRADSVLRNEQLITPTGRNLADGNVRKFLDVLDDYQGQQMPPKAMQKARQFLNDAAASTDATDRRIGSILKGEFDDWRNQLVPEYQQADALYGKVKRAQDVDFRLTKAENRAASTGTGGNTVNAMRQNLRQILDDPKKARGYSADELAAMRAIIRGDTTTNAMRLIGRLSPTSGALPLVGLGASSSAFGPLGAAPSALGYFARGGAEVRTQNQIKGLMDLILGGQTRAPKGYNAGEISGLLGAIARPAVTGD